MRTKQVSVPSVQANRSAEATARSSTMCTAAAAGHTALRMVVAPGATPVNSISFSADANDTRGMPRTPQNSRVTKGLSAGMTYR